MLLAVFTEAGAAAVIGSLGALIIAVTGLLVAVARVYIDIKRLHFELRRKVAESTRRDDSTDESVNVVVAALLRRGHLEAKKHNMLIETPDEVSNLATHIRPDVFEAYRPVLPTFKQLRESNPNLSREQFALLLEKQYGPWFARHICEVFGISNFACLDVAMRLVMGDVQQAGC